MRRLLAGWLDGWMPGVRAQVLCRDASCPLTPVVRCTALARPAVSAALGPLHTSLPLPPLSSSHLSMPASHPPFPASLPSLPLSVPPHSPRQRPELCGPEPGPARAGGRGAGRPGPSDHCAVEHSRAEGGGRAQGACACGAVGLCGRVGSAIQELVSSRREAESCSPRLPLRHRLRLHLQRATTDWRRRAPSSPLTPSILAPLPAPLPVLRSFSWFWFSLGWYLQPPQLLLRWSW